MSLNTCVISGRLTRDPESKTTQSGVSLCTFTVAVDRYSKKGEEKQTDFFDCVAWNKTAEVIRQYFSKGSPIIVQGPMQTETYTGKDGAKKKAWKLVVREFSFNGRNEGGGQNSAPAPASSTATDYGGFSELPDGDEDIPF